MVAVSYSFVYCHLPCSFHLRPLLGIFQAVQIFHYSRRVCCCLHDSTAISHTLTCQGKGEGKSLLTSRSSTQMLRSYSTLLFVRQTILTAEPFTGTALRLVEDLFSSLVGHSSQMSCYAWSSYLLHAC